MVMPYHLHMPSYFLETFTEYLSLTVIPQLLLVIIRGYVGRTALGLLENAPHVLSYNSQREKLDAT